MIEFKRYGDVMVFECPGFKIEVAGNGSERIELNRDAINTPSDFFEHIADAFKVLDMMLEHKARQTRDQKATEINFKVNVDTTEAEEAIRRLNEESSGSVTPSRPFIKLEGI